MILFTTLSNFGDEILVCHLVFGSLCNGFGSFGQLLSVCVLKTNNLNEKITNVR